MVGPLRIRAPTPKVSFDPCCDMAMERAFGGGGASGRILRPTLDCQENPVYSRTWGSFAAGVLES